MVKEVLLLVLLLETIIVSMTMVDIGNKYLTKENIASMNRVPVENAIPSFLVQYDNHESIWASYNNPTLEPQLSTCYIHKDLVKPLKKLKSKMNFRMVNCWLSVELQQKILSSLNTNFIKTDYGDVNKAKEYLSIDRSSGKIFDIEILDKNGNKKWNSNKYLNNIRWSDEWDITHLGFHKETQYPWMWSIK